MNPFKQDSDNDGMLDGYEVANQLDPHSDDSLDDKDKDRYPNVYEATFGTSSLNPVETPTFAPAAKAGARYYLVDPSDSGSSDWSDNFTISISEALNSVSQPFSIIEVRGGRYSENITLPSSGVLLISDGDSTRPPPEVEGYYGSASVSLRAGSVVDGFIVSHKPGRKGTGIHVNGWGNPDSTNRLQNCLIRGNVGDDGGIKVSSARLEIVNCTIFDNGSDDGIAAGIRSEYGSSVELRQSIVCNESGVDLAEISISDGSSLDVFDSIVKGGHPGGIAATGGVLDKLGYPTQPVPNGNIAVDQISSSDIRSAIDLFGEQRPINSSGDLGAVEWKDSDLDGVLDSWEIAYFGTLGRGLDVSDLDQDNLADLDEYRLGTDVSNPDTDGDDLLDGDEVSEHSDPFRQDSDGDSLSDGDEVNIIGTSPIMGDSDRDGMPDQWEYSWRTYQNAPVPDVPDAQDNHDGDDLTNIEEFYLGTNPCVYNERPAEANQDGDIFSNGDELNELFTDYQVDDNLSLVTDVWLDGNLPNAGQDWYTADGGMYLYATSGSANYSFTTSVESVYLVEIDWGVHFGNAATQVGFNVRVVCDGIDLGYHYLKRPPGTSGIQTHRIFLPYLN